MAGGQVSLCQGPQQTFGMTDDLGFSANSTVLIDDPDGGLFHRNIQSGIVFHAALPP
jgi:hypothetical protein